MTYFESLNNIVKNLPRYSGAFLESNKKAPLLARNFEQNCANFEKELPNHASSIVDDLKTAVVNNFMIRKGDEDEFGMEFFVDYVIEHSLKIYPPSISESELRQEMRNVGRGMNFEKIHAYQKECDWQWATADGNTYKMEVPEAEEIQRKFDVYYQACLSDEGFKKPSGLVKMYTTGGLVIEVTYTEKFVQVACGFSALSFGCYSQSDQMHWV